MKQAEFRKLSPEQRIVALRGQRAEREFRIDRATIDEESRTTWMSIASEEPYERWFGIEVLSITAGAIRDERLKSGAALLVGHNTDDQVGVIEKHKISGGKLRVLARFGKSARAEEIWQDVLDGIRRNTSVGYIIHDLELEKSDGDINTYRVISWEPIECSIVPCPADTTVGIGRSIYKGKPMGKDETLHLNRSQRRAATRGDDDDTVIEDRAESREFNRVNNILALGDLFKTSGGPELAREIIKDPNGTVDQFKSRMLDRQSAMSRPTPTAQPGEAYYGEGARSSFSHRKLRTFRGEDAERKAFAFGMFLKAQLPGAQDAVRWCAENGIRQERYINSGAGPAGAYVVPTEISSDIIKNMDTYGVFRREARSWPMNSEVLEIPTREGGLQARFVANDSETQPSDPSFGQVTLVAREVMTVTHVSRATMDDAVIDLGDFIAQEIGEAFAKLEDECGFIGDASANHGGMQGIIPKMAAGSKVAAASPHNLASEIDVTDFALLIAKLPQYAQPGAKFFMSQAVYGATALRLMLAAGGNTVRTLEAGASSNPSFAGFDVVLSPALPSDLTANYNATTLLLFGDLRRTAAFGDRQVISLLVDPYTLAGKAQIRIIGYERFHVINYGIGTATTAGPMLALQGTT